MGEKFRFVGMLTVSFSIMCLAAAIGYFGYELNGWRKQLPEIFSLVGDTSGQIAPVMERVSDVEKLIPPILEETEAVRKTVENLVAEVENTRKALPGILADLEPIARQIENTAEQLPGVIDPLLVEVGKTRETIPDILEQVEATNAEVAKIRELVPGILEEVRNTNSEIQQTREAMPGIMDRADQLVASASQAGREAGKGAMTGMIGGIIAAPFGVVGGLGKGVTGLFSSEVDKALTDKDRTALREKIIGLAENGKEGDVVTWKSANSSSHGTITLLRKYVEDSRECRELKVEAVIEGHGRQEETVNGCRQPDGSWVAGQ